MIVQEHISLAPFTTLGVGGCARFFIDALSEKDVREAVAFARHQSLPLYVLGKGSNILVPDAGIAGVVLHLKLSEYTVQEEGDTVLLIGETGISWEEMVTVAGERNAFGIENLAGIPGSLGGAAVQNIGAYGADFSEVFEYAEVFDRSTGMLKRVTREEATFAYRTSFLKEHRELIAVRIALRLTKKATPRLSYTDLARLKDTGVSLTTPREIAEAVRTVRAGKFPSPTEEGSAGSFFKNPIIQEKQAKKLAEQFSELPMFPQSDGTVKISLAWLLDHGLGLKGYTEGNVRLYEKQPLVVVAREGATATEIDTFARKISEKVFEATHLSLEREVELFSA